MILINLLPEEYIARKVDFRIPLRGIAIALFLVLFVLWLCVVGHRAGLNKEYASLEAELRVLTPRLGSAEHLIHEVNEEILPKRAFLNRFEKPEAHWAHVLNLISDAIPKGIWLTSLRLSDSPDFHMRTEGLAKSDRTRSAIGSVSDFATQVKKGLEELVSEGQRPADSGQGQLRESGRGSSAFNVETFTQQLERDQVKLTQFMLDFHRK